MPRAALPAGVRGLPPTFWFLWTGTLVNRLGGAVGPFLALLLTEDRDVTVTQAGYVLTAFGLGSAVGQVLGGYLTDRIGRRRTLLLGLFGAAAALAAVGLARSLLALGAAVLLYGVLLDLVRPAFGAAVADVVRPADRVRAYALTFWAINLGFAVAIPLGGWLAERGYWLLLAVDAATTLVFAVLVVVTLPETRPAAVPGVAPGRLADALSDRVLIALLVCVAGQATVYMQAFTTLPLVIADDGLGETGYGLVLGLNGVLIVVLQPTVLGVLARADRARLLLFAGLLQGGGMACHGLADTLLGHAAAVAVWTAGEVLQAGLLSAVVAGLAPVRLRGRYLGLFGASFGVAGLLAPLAGTQALAAFGEPALYVGCAALGALSAEGLRRVSRHAAARPPADA